MSKKIIAVNAGPRKGWNTDTLIDEAIPLNMKERNMYELMVNLLNGYYMYIKELTLILSEDAVESSKTSIINTIAFYSSFIFIIAFLAIIWHLLSKFLFERMNRCFGERLY